jgi:hypothetical protein
MNVWARANWSRYVTWRAYSAGLHQSALGATQAMTPGDAIDAAFALFHVHAPSPQTRTRLVNWLTAQRADTGTWDEYQLLNLLTLMMLSPDVNVA